MNITIINFLSDGSSYLRELQYNFSTYTVFWDNLLGTTWADKADAKARYERVRELTAKRSQDTAQQDAIAVTNRSMEKAVADGLGLKRLRGI